MPQKSAAIEIWEYSYAEVIVIGLPLSDQTEGQTLRIIEIRGCKKRINATVDVEEWEIYL